jgi:hypothetical protein
MSFVKQLQAGGTKEVEILDVKWRIHRPTSKDLLLAGATVLAMLPSAVEGEKGHIEQAAAQIGESPEAAGSMVTHLDALVCSALEALDAGKGWEPVEAVMHRNLAVPGTNRVWIENFPIPVRVALAREVLALTDDGGRWAHALNTFRVGSDAGDDR